MIKAVGYIRVSTVEQVDGESLNTQEKEIKRYAEFHDANLQKVYADKGKSGAKIEFRTELQELLKEASKGKFQLLIIHKISRLARNTKELLNIIEELKNFGVGLVSVNEKFDTTTPNGKLMLTILASFAEFEHGTIVEQTQQNRKARWQAGERYIGKPPYGYKVKNKKDLVVIKDEAKVYKMIANMYLNQRMSINDIAIELNAKGIKTRQGASKWNNAVIARMLKNTAYYGYHPVNMYVYKDGPRGAGTVRTKELKPQSEWIEYPIPALITKVEWDAIQEIISGFNKHKTKGVAEITKTFFLRDVLFCKHCGGKVKPVYGNESKKGNRPRYYVCHWAKVSKKTLAANQREKCKLRSIPADELEQYVWDGLMEPFKGIPEETLNELLSTDNFDIKIEEQQAIIERLTKVLQGAKRTKSNLLKLLQNPNLDISDLSEEFAKNKNELLTTKANIEDSQKKLELLLNQKEKQIEGITYIRENKESFQQIVEDLNNLQPEDKKIMVESMLDEERITVDYNTHYSSNRNKYKPEILYFRVFNQEILKRFADEGKIRSLGCNHTYYSCTH
uniref:recombinase family protein n=1 Tax=uncultured Draconibacterium sp. TaxID=1573823 RepID=UPI0032173FE7